MFGLAAHVGIDEAIGGHIMVIDRYLGFNFLLDLACELLAELNAHLVKRIDMPDHTLNKDFVLVECNEAPQSFWCQLLIQKRIGRAVATE